MEKKKKPKVKKHVVYWQDKNGRYYCYDADYPSEDLGGAQSHRAGCFGLHRDELKRIVIVVAKNGKDNFPTSLADSELKRWFEIEEDLSRRDIEELARKIKKENERLKPAPVLWRLGGK